jgi:hypothetical protein
MWWRRWTVPVRLVTCEMHENLIFCVSDCFSVFFQHVSLCFGVTFSVWKVQQNWCLCHWDPLRDGLKYLEMAQTSPALGLIWLKFDPSGNAVTQHLVILREPVTNWSRLDKSLTELKQSHFNQLDQNKIDEIIEIYDDIWSLFALFCMLLFVTKIPSYAVAAPIETQ